MDRGAWRATVHGVAKSQLDMTEKLAFLLSLLKIIIYFNYKIIIFYIVTNSVKILEIIQI